MVSLFLVLKNKNKKRHDNLVKSIYHSEFKMSKLYANYQVSACNENNQTIFSTDACQLSVQRSVFSFCLL